MTEQDVPHADSVPKAAPRSRLPSWMQRFGKSVRDIVKSPTLSSATLVTSVAQEKPAQRQERRRSIEPMTAQDRASDTRRAPRLSEEARDIRDTLGDKAVKSLLAGDLHPKKLKAVFSTLETANLGHAAKAGAPPPLPAMPKVAMPGPLNEATQSAKARAPSRAPAGSSVSVANPSSSSYVNGGASTPAGVNPSSPPAPRSRETLAKGRDCVAMEARERPQLNERSRSPSLGR